MNAALNLNELSSSNCVDAVTVHMCALRIQLILEYPEWPFAWSLVLYLHSFV